MRYNPAIGNELRDRYGRPGEIIEIVPGGDETKYRSQFQHAVGTITVDIHFGEVKKARRRYLKKLEKEL